MKRKIKAVIYVRGHNEEMQEIVCRVYALDKKYDVLYVTRDIDAVNNCDVLVVANRTRISRDMRRHYEIMNNLKKKGIEVESVAGQKNANESLMLAVDLFKADLGEDIKKAFEDRMTLK